MPFFGFIPVSITLKDVLYIWNLSQHHNDPFDRLLIAQSQSRNMPIITADSLFSLYENINIIW